jgi:hypothetical protein
VFDDTLDLALNATGLYNAQKGESMAKFQGKQASKQASTVLTVG